jgi:hypothetical protein
VLLQIGFMHIGWFDSENVATSFFNLNEMLNASLSDLIVTGIG